jgi:hypothetical protein
MTFAKFDPHNFSILFNHSKIGLSCARNSTTKKAKNISDLKLDDITVRMSASHYVHRQRRFIFHLVKGISTY